MLQTKKVVLGTVSSCVKSSSPYYQPSHAFIRLHSFPLSRKLILHCRLLPVQVLSSDLEASSTLCALLCQYDTKTSERDKAVQILKIHIAHNSRVATISATSVTTHFGFTSTRTLSAAAACFRPFLTRLQGTAAQETCSPFQPPAADRYCCPPAPAGAAAHAHPWL